MRNRSIIKLNALLVLSLLSMGAEAATCTSLSAGNWNTAARWDCGHVPVAADTVVVAHNITMNVNNASVTDLTVNPGFTLTLTSTPLTVSGNITNDGTITGANNRIVQSTGGAAIISGAGTFAGSSRLYISGTASIATGANLTFAGTTQIRAGRNGGTVVAGSVLTINGTITSTQAAGTNLLRLYATSTVIGATGVINAATSTISYNAATATVTNNGSVSVTSITQNATTDPNSWTQGVDSSLTVTAASTVGTLNASAIGNTVTYTLPAAPITPSSNTYYNLSGSGVPCPTTFIILGSSPCTMPPGVFSVTRSPTLCTNVATIGTAAWAGLANAMANDGVYSTATVARNVTTNYLQCTGYGFALPAGATVLGVVVNVKRHTSRSTVRDAAMRMIKGGVIGATDRSTATNYNTTDVTEAHGTSSDLWGSTWTAADINATNFGAAFAAMNINTNRNIGVSVDHMPISVFYSTPAIHHIEIDHPGSGSTCTPTNVTVIACGDAACNAANLYTLGASVTLSPGGNIVTIPAGSGSAIGTVASGTAGTVTLAGTSNPAAAGATTCKNTVSGAASCSFAFNSATINLSVPNGVSGNNVTGTISACTGGAFTGNKTINFYTTYANPITGTKQATINGTTIGTTAATSTAVTLNFNASSQATFTLSYPDVALVDLTASYAGTPTLSNGVSSFIMKPAGFVLTNIKSTNSGAANPGATAASGGAFVKAGEAFSVTVTAVNSAGAATPNFGRATPPEGVQLTSMLVGGLGLTNNPAVDRRTTGSMLSGSNSLTVTNPNGYDVGDRIRVAGAGAGGVDLFTTITAIAGNTFTLANSAATAVSFGQVQYTFGAFSGGSATGTNFNWDEVGIITLMPSVADGSYMTAGNVVGDRTGNPSGPVGRFTLGKFKLQPQAQDDRADICNGGVLIADGVTPCPAFTYMGEQFEVNFTLVPMSLNNIALQNYVGQNGAGDFAKLDPTVFANLGLAAVDRTSAGQPYYLSSRLSNAGMPAVTCNTTPCFMLGGSQAVANIAVPLTLTRNATPDGAYVATNIGIAPLDADNAPVDAVGAAGTGTCNNTTVAACYDMDSDAVAGNDHALVATTALRYGRTKISNAYGPELLGLVMPVVIEYWSGGIYVKSADDVGTVIAIALGNYQGNLTAGKTTPTVSAINNGVGQVNLSAPGANNNGSVDVSATSPAYLPSNPAGRATFGVYKGPFIYMREQY